MKQPVNWAKIRKAFGVTREKAYFQSAGMSPLPRQVFKTICKSYEKIYLDGDENWPNDLEQVGALREMLGRHINTGGQNVHFLNNTSLAFSMIALSLKKVFGEGFNLVSLEDEFPATNVPFEYQGIQMKYVKPEEGRYSVERIMEAVDEQTRGIVCSYVQYSTGFRLDLAALGKAAREKGLLFMVNATQGFPFFPVDVETMNIDVLTASLHKWGCAAHVGSLFFTTPAFRERFPAPIAGWLSVLPPPNDFIPTAKGEPLHIYADAKQYNFGTINFQGLLGLKTAFEFMEEIGWENIRKRVLELTDRVISRLMQIEEVEILSPHCQSFEQSGIISLDIKGHNNAECVSFLEKRGVITCVRQHRIRVSCNIFNNRSDINRLVDGIRGFISEVQMVD
ncbi:MAG: aminotransferase class V-fold PLP-dependent enzyme [Lentimicrobium sp.]|nr:aminotransferase class V-fold PLP-dependent enzyme [Lentimicrobium sp.]